MEILEEKYVGPERRRFPRLSASFVEYFPIGEIVSKKKSFTENISPVGICFLVDEKIELDTTLSLKIYLPGSKEAIEAQGKVVWTRESAFLSVKKRKHYDLGVEIVEIDSNDRQRIWQYIVKYIEIDKDLKGF